MKLFHAYTEVPNVTLTACNNNTGKWETLLDNIDTLRSFEAHPSSDKSQRSYSFTLAVLNKDNLRNIEEGLATGRWSCFNLYTHDKWKNLKTGGYEEETYPHAQTEILSISYASSCEGNPASFSFTLSNTKE